MGRFNEVRSQAGSGFSAACSLQLSNQGDAMERCNSNSIPTPAQLSKLLSFCPDTGKITWKKTLSNRVSPGREAGGPDGQGYRVLMVQNYCVRAHRVAWALHYGKWPEGFIDHINGNRSDNRISNLRDVTNALNLQNSHKPQKNSSTGFRGVFLDRRRGRFTVELSANRVRHRLGSFSTAEEAYAAYLAAKALYHPHALAA